jgi:hypothetical protein
MLLAVNLFAAIPRASAATLVPDSRGRSAADGIAAEIAAQITAVDASNGLAAEIAAGVVAVSAARIAAQIVVGIAAVGASNAGLAVAKVKVVGIKADAHRNAVHNSFPKC